VLRGAQLRRHDLGDVTSALRCLLDKRKGGVVITDAVERLSPSTAIPHSSGNSVTTMSASTSMWTAGPPPMGPASRIDKHAFGSPDSNAWTARIHPVSCSAFVGARMCAGAGLFNDLR
jgi:hypothetical protein